MKRMCIKTLPKVLAIHLKRFDYDWERFVIPFFFSINHILIIAEHRTVILTKVGVNSVKFRGGKYGGPQYLRSLKFSYPPESIERGTKGRKKG